MCIRDSRVPGIADYEEQAYWRDVGTIDAYYDAHRDAMGEQPRFKLFNPQWVINSSNYQGPSARILSGHIENTALGPGSLIPVSYTHLDVYKRQVHRGHGLRTRANHARRSPQMVDRPPGRRGCDAQRAGEPPP